MRYLSLLNALLLWACQVGCLFGQDIKKPLPVIKKCHCAGDEVRSRSGCQKRDKLQLIIWDSETKSTKVVDVSTLSSNSTIIQPLTCPDGMILDVYNDLPFISTEGKLVIHPHPETDLYCLEYVLSDSNDVFHRTERCIEKLSVRLCCQTDEYLDALDRCTKIPSHEKRQLVLNWLQNFNYAINRSICDEEDNGHKMIPQMQQSSLSHMKEYLLSVAQKTLNNFCLGMYGDENEMYFGVSYCLSAITGDKHHPPTIPYCCEVDQAFDINRFRCVPQSQHFIFPMESILWPAGGIGERLSLPNCSAVGVLNLNESGLLSFAPNGSLLTESGHATPASRYCLGSLLLNNQTLHSGLTCLVGNDPIHCSWRWDINVACFIISSLFLVATLVVYIGVPELRRRIGGVCLISELLALLVSQITIIVLHMNARNFSPSGCLAAGVIEIIFLLASFFWLNIMCYDVWSTFRVFRPYSEKVLQWRLFVKYSLYGWGVPLLVGVVAVVVEKVGLRLRPGFSPDTGCFFSDEDLALQWLYLYAWILLLLLVNLVMFVHVAFTLYSNYAEQKKHFNKSEGSKKSGHASSSSPDVENLKLHGKLFIIMGVPWLLEVFTSLAPAQALCYIWFLDLVNVLRGVLIFIIFVCKSSVRDLILKNWFPWYQSNQVAPDPSRKTSTMSLSSWFSSLPGRKISKVSLSSGGDVANVRLEALKEEGDGEGEPKGNDERGRGEERRRDLEGGQVQETQT